jgi:hypothetical protein
MTTTRIALAALAATAAIGVPARAALGCPAGDWMRLQQQQAAQAARAERAVQARARDAHATAAHVPLAEGPAAWPDGARHVAAAAARKAGKAKKDEHPRFVRYPVRH